MQFRPFLSEFDGFNRSLAMELKKPENVVISEDHIIFSLSVLFFEMIFPIWNANRHFIEKLIKVIERLLERFVMPFFFSTRSGWSSLLHHE